MKSNLIKSIVRFNAIFCRHHAMDSFIRSVYLQPTRSSNSRSGWKTMEYDPVSLIEFLFSSPRQISGILFFLLCYSRRTFLFVFSCIYVIFTIESTEICRPRESNNISWSSTLTRLEEKIRSCMDTSIFVSGLSFRPQISSNLHDVQTLISLSTNHGKGASSDSIEIYTKSLDDFLHSCKWWEQSFRSENVRLPSDYSTSNTMNFTIADVNDCKSDKQYGFTDGKPCILIKMNKVCFIVFIRNQFEILSWLVLYQKSVELMRIVKKKQHVRMYQIFPFNAPAKFVWKNISKLIYFLQYPFDRDMLGDIMYYSESGSSDVCGSIDVKHFPYP